LINLNLIIRKLDFLKKNPLAEDKSVSAVKERKAKARKVK